MESSTRITTSTINLNDVKIYGFHGVSDEEQQVGTWYNITISLNTKLSPLSYLNDQLEGTIDYSAVLTLIKEEFAVKSRILEHLAYRIANKILSSFSSVQNVTIEIQKLAPPMSGNIKSASVKMTIERQ